MHCKIKNNIINIILVVAAITVYTIFGISLVNRWEVALYVSGVFMLIIFIATFFEPLLKKQRIQIIDWIIMGFSFVSFIVLLALYIATIPNDVFKNVILTLSSATVGGVLTLTGVGLSIKYTRIFKEEERLEELKPHIFIVGDARWSTLTDDKKVSTVVPISEDSFVKNPNENYKFAYELVLIKIANSDSSISVLRGLFFDNEFIRFKYEVPLTKDSYTMIIFDSLIYGTNKKLNNVSFLCEDILQNQYIIELGFELEKRENKYSISIMSAHNAEPIEVS